MSPAQVGNKIPDGGFPYIPYTPELADGKSCGVPSKVTTDDWKGKRVVIFAVPGAFTPTCHVSHLPGFVSKYDELKAKGVDVVACLASNDHWVMSGWGRVEGVEDKILMLSDVDGAWSDKLGLKRPDGRTKRYAIIVDDLVIKSLEVETESGVNVSGAEHVLSRL